jgi:hypothetical protein
VVRDAESYQQILDRLEWWYSVGYVAQAFLPVLFLGDNFTASRRLVLSGIAIFPRKIIALLPKSPRI